MNFLKKKLKPLTGSSNKHKTPDEDDPYDDYIPEAPPHPSDLIAAGLDPNLANDPDKLKELLFSQPLNTPTTTGTTVATTKGILLAKQKRQLEQIEENKKNKEEWKFFDSITARVDQATRKSAEAIKQLKESSAVDEICEPEYELRETVDDVFKHSPAGVDQSSKLEHSAVTRIGDKDGWVAFDDDRNETQAGSSAITKENQENKEEDDKKQEGEPDGVDIVEELLEDFGLDLRPSSRSSNRATTSVKKATVEAPTPTAAKPAAIVVNEPRVPPPTVAVPRPEAKRRDVTPTTTTATANKDLDDPFDTSFVDVVEVDNTPKFEATFDSTISNETVAAESAPQQPRGAPEIDPFDTAAFVT